MNAATPEAPELLEWFRLDRGGTTRVLLVLGTVCVFFGCAAIAGAFLSRQTELVHLISTGGAALLLFGLLTAFGGMGLLLSHDDYLAVREDGILLHHARGDKQSTERVVPWDVLEAVRVEGGHLVFETKDESIRVVDRYTGASPEELAAHLDALRRKAQIERINETVVKRIAIGLPHVRPR